MPRLFFLSNCIFNSDPLYLKGLKYPKELMMNAILTLPEWRTLPINLILDSLTGYLFGRMVRVNPVLTTTIFATRCIAHTLLFKLTAYLFKADDLKSHKIFVCTSAVVNMTFIIVLREMNLSSHLISIALSLALFGKLITHVSYIETQQEEKAAEVAVP